MSFFNTAWITASSSCTVRAIKTDCDEKYETEC